MVPSNAAVGPGTGSRAGGVGGVKVPPGRIGGLLPCSVGGVLPGSVGGALAGGAAAALSGTIDGYWSRWPPAGDTTHSKSAADRPKDANVGFTDESPVTPGRDRPDEVREKRRMPDGCVEYQGRPARSREVAPKRPEQGVVYTSVANLVRRDPATSCKGGMMAYDARIDSTEKRTERHRRGPRIRRYPRLVKGRRRVRWHFSASANAARAVRHPVPPAY